ncbi:MAG: hypothetical protein IJX38_01300 [Clostridia bacterium]|nr:hypothetical protein [Clostridia bacterium]
MATSKSSKTLDAYKELTSKDKLKEGLSTIVEKAKEAKGKISSAGKKVGTYLSNFASKLKAAKDAEVRTVKTNTEDDGGVAEVNSRYDSYMKALDDEKRRSEQNASIMLDKIKKYLPMQMKAQGLGGLGVSENAALGAMASYKNALADIESGYRSDKTDYDIARSAELSALDQAKSDKLEIYRDKLYDIEKANLLGKLENSIGADGKMSRADYDSALKSIGELEGNIGKENADLLRAELGSYAESVRSTDLQHVLDSANAIDNTYIENEKYSDGDYGDNFVIVRGGRRYRVEKGEEASDNTALYNAYEALTGKEAHKGAVLEYDGKVYVHLYTHKGYGKEKTWGWYVVQDRGSEEYGTGKIG